MFLEGGLLPTGAGRLPRAGALAHLRMAGGAEAEQ